MKFLRYILIVSVIFLSGCIGTIIETTTDAAIAVAKIPFKVGGAVVDVVTGDKDDFTEQSENSDSDIDNPENQETYIN